MYLFLFAACRFFADANQRFVCDLMFHLPLKVDFEDDQLEERVVLQCLHQLVESELPILRAIPLLPRR